jgi:hypothetical protein
VRLEDGYGQIGSIQTNPDGTFLGYLRPGPYQFQVSKYAYDTQYFPGEYWYDPFDVAAGEELDLGTIRMSPCWDAPPVYTDPYEPNDTTATANPIAPDGSVFTGYCDASGADYLSFSASAGQLYHVSFSTRGRGGGCVLGVYSADGTALTSVQSIGGLPATSTLDVWYVSGQDQTLFLGLTNMDSSASIRALNPIPDSLVAYHVSVTACARPVVRGTVIDPATGKPLVGARVHIWTNPVVWAGDAFPSSADIDETTLTAPDGTYSFTLATPCQALVFFDDPSGERFGEYFNHSATFVASSPCPGATLVSCTADQVVTADGYLENSGGLVVRAIRADTGEPIRGVPFWLLCRTFDGWDPGLSQLPDTGPDGTTEDSRLDPHKSYGVMDTAGWIRWSDDAVCGPYQFVGFADEPDFIPSEGATRTITALWELQASQVSLSILPTAASTARPCVTEVGRVVFLGSGVASIPVVIEFSTDASSWAPVGTTSTDSTGAFSLKTPAQASGYYRARFVGSHDVGAGVSSAVQFVDPPAVSTITKLRAPGSVRRGKTLKLIGTVAASGKVRVYLYRLVSRKWKSAGTATVSVRSGKFTYSFKAKYKGKWRFRAHYLGSAPSYLASWSGGYANTNVK